MILVNGGGGLVVRLRARRRLLRGFLLFHFIQSFVKTLEKTGEIPLFEQELLLSLGAPVVVVVVIGGGGGSGVGVGVDVRRAIV